MNKIWLMVVIWISALIPAVGQGTPGDLPGSISGTGQIVSPTCTRNYIVTHTYLSPFTDHPGSLKAGDSAPVVEYFDGLGRPVEHIRVMESQTGGDLVSRQKYNDEGNLIQQWLPYAKPSNHGSYVDSLTFKSEQIAFLTGVYGTEDGSKGYSVTEYEKSPLSRVEKQGAPGSSWQLEHPVTTVYKTNTVTDNVQSWKYTGHNFSVITYPANSLFLTETADEDGNAVREFKDIQGRLVMNERGSSRTRYCYDEYGRLRCVVQPQGVSPASTEDCFYYKYDDRGRLTDKKAPSGAWIFCIYDNRHRLVLSQDGNQRYGASPPEWSYTLYDHLDRPTEQGVWSSTSTRASLVSNIELNAGYLVGRPERIPLKYLHYNDYADCPAANSINAADTSALGVRQCPDNTGRLTWERTRMLNLESGITEWLVSAFYYDIYGRLIQTVSDNHLGGKEYITHKYNFSGQARQTRHRHMTGGTTIWTDLYHDYDHRGRVVKTRYQIDGASEVLMAGYSYDQTGAQRIGYLHSESGGSFLQRNNYTYNIRGWLTQINNPSTFTENSKFGLKLYYNGGPWPCPTFYNGNIAGMLWGTPTHSSMYYVYSYDGNNRMTNANFSRSGMSPTALDVSYTYDLNGNIKTLDRYGFQGTYIDRLTITYSGNQVIGLSDASGDVAQVTDYPGISSPMALNYDDNGNVDVETHKLIETTYNLLNLPFELNWLGQNRRINYYYTFEGEKLRKRVENNGILTKEDYCGPYVYETASGVRSLKYIVTPKGRAVRSGSNWTYEYHLADHLGNVRAVIRKGANGMAELIQQRHYYPFGMEISNMSSGTGTNKYLYNGKAIQNDFDLYWYDYGARFYDPELCRFHSVDPLASDYSSWTPYHYVHNNPILLVDPTGMSADWYEDENKKLVYDETIKSQTDLDTKGIKGEYKGEKGYGINEETGALQTYQPDGTITESSLASNDITVKANPVTTAIYQGQKEFINHPVTQATINGLTFVASGGIEGVAALGSGIVRGIGNLRVPIYRVFGGEARAIGNYWSPINPRLYGSQYRNLAGLPNTNTGAFTLKATTALKNINPSTIKPAAPLDGNFGRLVPELKVFDKSNIVVKDFWVNF